jgi:hypothetical protein
MVRDNKVAHLTQAALAFPVDLQGLSSNLEVYTLDLKMCTMNTSKKSPQNQWLGACRGVIFVYTKWDCSGTALLQKPVQGA